MATQPSPLPDASGTTRGAVSLTTQTLGVGEKSADQLATPIVRLSHSVPASGPAANEVKLQSLFGVLQAAEAGAYDTNYYPVRSHFPAYVDLDDTTVELSTQGGVVSFLPLTTVFLTGSITLLGGAMGPVTFSTSGSSGIVTIAILAETPGSGFTVTIPNGPLCRLNGGVNAVLKLYDSITLAYAFNSNCWIEVSRNIT